MGSDLGAADAMVGLVALDLKERERESLQLHPEKYGTES